MDMTTDTEFFALGLHGKYLPQFTIEILHDKKLIGVDRLTTDTLLEGPEHVLYWECWDTFLGSARVVIAGIKYAFLLEEDLLLKEVA